MTVGDVPPSPMIHGLHPVDEGSPFALGLEATAPVSGWVVQWSRDSAPQNVAGNPSVVEHTYTRGPSRPVITASATIAGRSFLALPSVPALSSGLAYDAVVLGDQPLGYWRLNESAGLVAANSVPGGPAGTYVGNVGRGVIAVQSTGAHLDGATAAVTTNQGLDDLGAFSLEVWVRPTAVPPSRTGLIGQNNAVEFGFIDGSTLQLWTSATGGLNVPYEGPIGSWAHLVGVGTGSELRIYVNGQLVASRAHAPVESYGASPYRLRIGGAGVFDPSGGFFAGDLDEAAVYDHALTEEQAAEHFLAGAGLRVTVNNVAATANPDAYSVLEDNALVAAAPALRVLANDTDPGADLLSAVLVSGPSHAQPGTFTLAADGGFTYVPVANFNGTDSFRYKAHDGDDDSNVTTVTITVNPVNDPPVVTVPFATASVVKTNPITFVVTADDVDFPYDPNHHLSYSFVGPATISPPTLTRLDEHHARFTWTPTQDDGPGSYAFAFTATDNGSPTNTAPLSDKRTVIVTTVAAGMVGDDLQIVGTSGPDTATVIATDLHQVHVNVNGTPYGPFDLAGGGSIDARLFGGDDTITLIGWKGLTALDGGNGADAARIEGVPGAGPLRWNGLLLTDESSSVTFEGFESLALDTQGQANPLSLGGISLTGGLAVTARSIAVNGPIVIAGAGGLAFHASQGIAIATAAIDSGPGPQLYDGAVALGGDLTVTGRGLTFAGTIDGPYTLRALSDGPSAFLGTVGGTMPLIGVITDAPGTTVLGASMTTSGDLSFHDPVYLTADLTLTDSGPLSTGITFFGTIDSADLATPHALTVLSNRPKSFKGPIGSQFPLASLTTNVAVAGQPAVPTQLDAPEVTTTGDQLYRDALEIGVRTGFNAGGSVVFGGMVSQEAGLGDLGLTVKGGANTQTLDLSHAMVPVTLEIDTKGALATTQPIVIGGQNVNTFIKDASSHVSVTFVAGGPGSQNTFRVVPSNDAPALVDQGGYNLLDLSSLPLGATLDLSLNQGQRQSLYVDALRSPDIEGRFTPGELDALALGSLSLTGAFQAVIDSPHDDVLYAAAPLADPDVGLAMPTSGSLIVLTGGQDKVYGAPSAAIQSFGGGDQVDQAFSTRAGEQVSAFLAANPARVQAFLSAAPAAQLAFLQRNATGYSGYIVASPVSQQAFLQQSGAAVAQYIAVNPSGQQAYLAQNSTALAQFIVGGATGQQAFLQQNSTAFSQYLASAPAGRQAFLQQSGAAVSGFLAASPTARQAFLQRNSAGFNAYLLSNTAARSAFLAADPAAEQAFLQGGSAGLQAYLQANPDALAQYVAGDPAALQQFLMSDPASLLQYLLNDAAAQQAYVVQNSTAVAAFIVASPDGQQAYLAQNGTAAAQFIAGSTASQQAFLRQNAVATSAYIIADPTARDAFLASSPAGQLAYLTGGPDGLLAFLQAQPDALQQFLGSNPSVLQQFLLSNPTGLLQYLAGSPAGQLAYVQQNAPALAGFIVASSTARQAFLQQGPSAVAQYLVAHVASQQAFVTQNPAGISAYLISNADALNAFLISDPAAQSAYLQGGTAGAQAYLLANPAALQQFLASQPAALQQFLASSPASLQQFLSASPTLQQAYIQENAAAIAQYLASSPTGRQAYVGQDATGVSAYLVGNPAAREAFLAGNADAQAAYLQDGPDGLQAYLMANLDALQQYVDANPTVLQQYLVSASGILQQYLMANPAVFEQFLAASPSVIQQYLMANPAVFEQFLAASPTALLQFLSADPTALQQFLASNPTILQQYVSANPTVLQAFLTSDTAILQQFVSANPTVLQQFLASNPTILQQYISANPTALQAYLDANTAALQQFVTANPDALQQFLASSPTVLTQYLLANPGAQQAYIQQNAPAVAQFIAASPTARQAYLQANAPAVAQFIAASPTNQQAFLQRNADGLSAYIAASPTNQQAFLQGNSAGASVYIVATPTALNAFIDGNPEGRQAYLTGGPAGLLAFLQAAPSALQAFLNAQPTILQQYLTSQPDVLRQYIAENTGVLVEYLANNPDVLQQYLSVDPSALQQYLTANPDALQQYLAANPTALEQFLANNPTVLQQYLTANPAALEQYLASNPAILAQFVASNPALLQQFLALNPAVLQQFLQNNPSLLRQILDAAVLDLFRFKATLSGTGNQASGGLLSSFHLGSGLFRQTITAGELELVNRALERGAAIDDYQLRVTFDGGDNVIVGGLLGTFTAGSGNDRFVIQAPNLLGLPSDAPIAPAIAEFGGTFHGQGGNDTFAFVGGEDGNRFGHVVVTEPSASGAQTVDFSNFQAGPVTLDLARGDEQTIHPDALWLTLPDDITSAVGSPFSDTIIGNALDNALQGADLAPHHVHERPAVTTANVPVQWVLLDFETSTSMLGGLVYSTADQQAVLEGLRRIYAVFENIVQFTLDPAAAQANAPDGYVTIFFNSTPIVDDRPHPGGHSEEIDFRNLNRATTVQVDVNGFLGDGLGQLANSPDNFRNLSITIGAHELGHSLGLRHRDALGPIAFGVANPPGPGGFLPAYPGPVGAFGTNRNIMASPASVGSTLSDAASDQNHLGEREAVKLAFIAGGVVLDATSADHHDLADAMPVSLHALNVPNPITEGFNAGKTFDVAAVSIVGRIGPGPEIITDAEGRPVLDENGLPRRRSVSDFYRLDGQAGDLINFEVMSAALTRITRHIDPVVRVYGPDGALVAYYNGTAINDDDFEPPDSALIDLVLPQDGTYTIEIDTFHSDDPMFIDPDSPNYNPDAYYDSAQGDYELLVYRFDAFNADDGNDRIDGGAGADALSGGPGDDALQGGDGDDVLSGGGGTNDLQGGPGVNTAAEAADTNFVLADGRLFGPGTDNLTCIQKASLLGGLGDNTFLVLPSWTSAVTLDGGTGRDTLAALGDFAAHATTVGPFENVLIQGDFDGTLLAQRDLGLVAIGGKFSGHLIANADLATLTVNRGMEGRAQVEGTLGSATFNAAVDECATLAAGNLGVVTVVDNMNGAIDVTGALATGRFEGAVTSSASIRAGSLTTLSITRNLAGTVQTTGPIGSITVGEAVTNPAVIIAGALGSLAIAENLTGNVQVGGTIGSITVGGAVRGPARLTAQGLGTLDVSRNFTGDIDVSGHIGSITVGEAITNPANLVAGSVGTLAVNENLTGTVRIKGALASATVGGSLSNPGVIAVGSLGALNISRNANGVIASEGDIGAFASGTTRSGGISIGGNLGGELVSLGNMIGDLRVNGGLRSARIAVKGDIKGNVSIENGLDSSSIVVVGGRIGDAALGTRFRVGGKTRGAIAALGTIRLNVSPTSGALIFSNAAAPDAANAAVIDAIFSGTTRFDLDSLELSGLNRLLKRLRDLKLKQGKLVLP